MVRGIHAGSLHGFHSVLPLASFMTFSDIVNSLMP